MILVFFLKCSSEEVKSSVPVKPIAPPMEDKYSGATKAGKRHGKGTLIKGDGTKYVGEFRNGEFEGKGVLEKPDGGKYEGEFKNSLFHGKGKFSSAEGEVFEGDFKDGKFFKTEYYFPQ